MLSFFRTQFAERTNQFRKLIDLLEQVTVERTAVSSISIGPSGIAPLWCPDS
jgi:hypothetical protein